VWEEILTQRVARKLFGQVWEIRAKFFRTPKILPAPTPMPEIYVVYVAGSSRSSSVCADANQMLFRQLSHVHAVVVSFL